MWGEAGAPAHGQGQLESDRAGPKPAEPTVWPPWFRVGTHVHLGRTRPSPDRLAVSLSSTFRALGPSVLSRAVTSRTGRSAPAETGWTGARGGGPVWQDCAPSLWPAREPFPRPGRCSPRGHQDCSALPPEERPAQLPRGGKGGVCSGSSSLQIRLADLGWGEGRASGGHAQRGRCPQPVAEAAGSSNRAKPRLPSPRGEHEVLGVHQRKCRVLLGTLSRQPASSLLPGLSWVGAWPPSRPGTGRCQHLGAARREARGWLHPGLGATRLPFRGQPACSELLAPRPYV